jgi:rhamnogalacturonyl hydrolase YesR
MVNKLTNEPVTDITKIDTNTVLKQGDYRLNSYEWGVTYTAMLLAGETTGDKRYTEYVQKRFSFLGEWIPAIKKMAASGSYKNSNYPLRQSIEPKALDDAGAVCAAMIKAQRAGVNTTLRPIIDHFIDFVATKEYRFVDGTLGRNRPQKNTLWLDDLYMGVPALAQMGKLTGNKKYFDDAVKQVKQFAARMFNKEKGVYMHGWMESMEVHPEFRWARANGWAIMAKVELLDVLPENHPGRPYVLAQLKAHAKGLAAYQSGSGFWHQLLDREDSYLETSATAIYAYCLAHACNKGWLDPQAYGPAAMLAWNAVATKINDKGQVEGTCVGTGMAFDPAFYYHRPVNVFAAHGYGPVLLAGAEIYRMLEKNAFKINDSGLHYYK